MKMDALAEFDGLGRTLGFHMQRHGVLASNLANADTPGYQPLDLAFTDAMQQAGGQLDATHAQHLGGSDGAGSAGAQGEVVEVDPASSLDKNGVQVEHTLAQVTANRLRYETGIELTRRRFALLRYAATDGSGG